MYNLDKSRFANLRPEDEEYFCGICFGILNNPMVTPCCRQTYCSDCIVPWIRANNTCPNDRSAFTSDRLTFAPRIITNVINQFKVTCDYRNNGCNDIVMLENLANHVNRCRHNPESICDVCNEINGDKRLHNCYESLTLKIKNLELTNGRLATDYASLESENDSLKKENSNLKQEIKIKCQSIGKLNKSISDLNQKKRWR